MTFQALDYKWSNFLDLIDDTFLPTKPAHAKGGT